MFTNLLFYSTNFLKTLNLKVQNSRTFSFYVMDTKICQADYFNVLTEPYTK